MCRRSLGLKVVPVVEALLPREASGVLAGEVGVGDGGGWIALCWCGGA